MASACIHEGNLGKNLKYLHPNIISNIDSYKKGNYCIFPSCHGCRYRNRNGTRKRIQTRENSVSFLSVVFVREQQKRNT